MPPASGTAPPLRPLPAPRGVTGMRSRLAIFIMSETCWVVEGLTTASGMCPQTRPAWSHA